MGGAGEGSVITQPVMKQGLSHTTNFLASRFKQNSPASGCVLMDIDTPTTSTLCPSNS